MHPQMVLPYTLTPDFPRSVDNLIHGQAHAARADADGAAGGAAPQSFDSGQADLVRAALHQLSSTWAAFLLWPYRVRQRDDDLPEASGYETLTTENIARAQRRHLMQQVLARDDSRCFVSGALDFSAWILRYAHDVPSGYGYRGSPYPASTGGAF
ncbi:hypothetical protein V8D89_006665 [Ganoderma adspersum]